MIYEFSPTQSYNGYDKPWAPGAGANQWDEEWEVGGLDAQGDPVDQQRIRSKNFCPCLAETSYYLVDPTRSNNIKLFYYADDYEFISASNWLGTTYVSTPAGTAFFKLVIGVSYGTTYKNDIAINYPHTITTYSPYANTCMPIGFNIWDPTNQEYVQVYAGYVNANTRELYLRPVYTEYNGEELVGPWMSSWDLYEEDTTPTEGAFVVDLGGDLISLEITPFMLQTLLDSLGIRQHFLDGASLLNSLMDQAQGRVRSEDELLHDSLHVIPIGDSLPIGLHIRPILNDVLPGLPGKFIR